MSTVIVLLTIAVAVLRFCVPTHPLSWPGTYQALAHVYVGMLAVPAWQRAGLCRTCFWLLVAAELIAFAWGHAAG